MAKRLTLQEFMRSFCDGRSREKDNRATICDGDSAGRDVYGVGALVPAGCREVEEWEDGRFRSVWVNDSEHYTITYCEGDIFVVVCPDAESYAAEIAEATEFYRDH
jgi:hypothetical protein